MCMTKLFLSRHNTYLLPPDREHIAGQSTDPIEVQLEEPMSFIGIIYRNMDEGLLAMAEMTHRNQSPLQSEQ